MRIEGFGLIYGGKIRVCVWIYKNPTGVECRVVVPFIIQMHFLFLLHVNNDIDYLFSHKL